MLPIPLKSSLVIVFCTCFFYGCSKTESKSKSAGTLPTKYIVQPGDNLTNIAIKFYGDERQRKLLFEANSDALTGPDQIKVGQILKIPVIPKKEPEKSKPTSQAPFSVPATYAVRPGDKLSGIATSIMWTPGLDYLISDAYNDVLHEIPRNQILSCSSQT